MVRSYRRLVTRFWMPAIVMLSSAACVASKGDVRLLQDELRSLRSTIAHSDTIQLARTDSAMQLIARASDSVKALSARVSGFQANTSGSLYDMSRQLVQIQELTGQGQRRLQEIRAQIEAQHEAALSAPVPSTSDTAKGADAAGAGPGPGPSQLFLLSHDQMARGSYGTARTGFEQLLTLYPNFEDAPLAQLYIGMTFSGDRNDAAADSVYQLVVKRYPSSAQAATALYKRAELLRGAGRSQEARALLQRLLHDYPRSDEAGLARDLLGLRK